MQLTELIEFLESELDSKAFDDFGPNGLQVEGRPQVQRIAFAVSAAASILGEAASWGADAVVVHHGIFWNFHGARPLVGGHGKRVRLLVENHMSLVAFHLPLDAHPRLGNAAYIATRLGLEQLQPFGETRGRPTGICGCFSTPQEVSALVAALESLVHHPVLHASPPGRSAVRRVGIITGGARSGWQQAAACGLEMYISGEMSEHDWHEAAEAGIHFLAAGHHATERGGVLSLMHHLELHFPGQLTMRYFESPNPA